MPETLADFPPDVFMMVARCLCGHEAKIKYSHLPPETTTDYLSSRLVCTQCGRRNPPVQRIYTGYGSLMPSARNKS